MQSQNKQIHEQTENQGDCLSPKELVDLHLQNKDHKISDEDLKRVALDCSDLSGEDETPAMVSSTNNVLQDRTEDESETVEKEEKPITPTPLDVLS